MCFLWETATLAITSSSLLDVSLCAVKAGRAPGSCLTLAFLSDYCLGAAVILGLLGCLLAAIWKPHIFKIALSNVEGNQCFSERPSAHQQNIISDNAFIHYILAVRHYVFFNPLAADVAHKLPSLFVSHISQDSRRCIFFVSWLYWRYSVYSVRKSNPRYHFRHTSVKFSMTMTYVCFETLEPWLDLKWVSADLNKAWPCIMALSDGLERFSTTQLKWSQW